MKYSFPTVTRLVTELEMDEKALWTEERNWKWLG